VIVVFAVHPSSERYHDTFRAWSRLQNLSASDDRRSSNACLYLFELETMRFPLFAMI